MLSSYCKFVMELSSGLRTKFEITNEGARNMFSLKRSPFTDFEILCMTPSLFWVTNTKTCAKHLWPLKNVLINQARKLIERHIPDVLILFSSDGSDDLT